MNDRDLPERPDLDEPTADDGVVELAGEDLACVCVAIAEPVEDEPAHDHRDLPGLEQAVTGDD